jgi:hypothetical protein
MSRKRTAFDKNFCMAVRDIGRLIFVCGDPKTPQCIHKKADISWARPEGGRMGSSCAYGFGSGSNTICCCPDAQDEAIAEFSRVIEREKEKDAPPSEIKITIEDMSGEPEGVEG